MPRDRELRMEKTDRVHAMHNVIKFDLHNACDVVSARNCDTTLKRN